ncbi:CGNR zinc finger domain-containing protein [Saccharopolyspora hordei]|uniref:Putative RNA-binding Zn ribbon-like protein n=1 Tax=Saccharopolyspora hordei TaxID=1838 RepID=A0A853AJE8_9PSEU|nr:CGNR zinc finger domain-containing protein [Saccharopolyspora hordei]NYI84784.1 putative RNA-binding Zn ribbon-like protein [Saccharopolyspora hordei]
MRPRLPLIGEPLAVDLVNTRAVISGDQIDMMGTPEKLQEWLTRQADRMPTPHQASPDEEDLAAVHAVREHVARTLSAVRRGKRPPADALRGLNEAQRAAPGIRRLSWRNGSVVSAVDRPGKLGLRVAAELAEAAAELLTDPIIELLRECEEPNCVMLFVARNPRRRWCSAAICGNRVRVARYYRRHKAAV